MKTSFPARKPFRAVLCSTFHAKNTAASTLISSGAARTAVASPYVFFRAVCGIGVLLLSQLKGHWLRFRLELGKMDTGSGFKSRRCSSISSLGVGGREWGRLVSACFLEKKKLGRQLGSCRCAEQRSEAECLSLLHHHDIQRYTVFIVDPQCTLL